MKVKVKKKNGILHHSTANVCFYIGDFSFRILTDRQHTFKHKVTGMLTHKEKQTHASTRLFKKHQATSRPVKNPYTSSRMLHSSKH